RADLDIAEAKILVPVVATAVDPQVAGCPPTETLWGQTGMEQWKLAKNLIDGGNAVQGAEPLVEFIDQRGGHHDGESLSHCFRFHAALLVASVMAATASR